jgi:tRNA pseudouridine38-40 synthase
MRIALKIAYDGRSFYGHQRQPDRRTVEGECIAALRSARLVPDPQQAFFRSASRTDRGVSAIGNVIAFDASLEPAAVLGAFNDKARDVWAWAVAGVPDGFHPRHAIERWYRYDVFEDLSVDLLRKAGALFSGVHDFRSFTKEETLGKMTLRRIDVTPSEESILIDVRAPSFRRGMVRRIVAGMVAAARGEVSLEDLRRALSGTRRDFGSMPPEPLVLMDVSYDFPFRVILKPKVADEWRNRELDSLLHVHLYRLARAAAVPAIRSR